MSWKELDKFKEYNNIQQVLSPKLMEIGDCIKQSRRRLERSSTKNSKWNATTIKRKHQNKMKLLKNYVLVAETVKEEKTAGGIILSGDVQLDKSSKPGLVIATGPEC